MSKCDLEIVFDRAERTYRGGEEITGTVRVQVNQDVSTGGVILEHFWQTHGRGNTATGPKQRVVLAAGDLRAGQFLSYPFRLTAPDGPPTYRGRYLNVDHYVYVRVDVPWAIDPKLKEEYILLPGSRAYGNLSSQYARAFAKKGLSSVGTPLGVALLVLGPFLFFPCGLILIPVGLGILFFSLRKVLAEKKIGKVTLSWGSLHVAPGGELPLRVSFTPRQSSQLNQITAKLVGMERCVSGSGTNRSTHTHKLYERTVPLVSACDVTAYQPIQVDGRVPIPETGAFSFTAKDNELIWELEVRIDIPVWPDWVEKRAVTVRPAVEGEFVEVEVLPEPSSGAPGVALPIPAVGQPQPAEPDVPIPQAERFTSPETGAFGTPEPVDSGEAVEEPAPAEPAVPPEPVVPDERVSEPPPAPTLAGTDPALIEIVGRLSSSGGYSWEQEEIIKQHSERPFDCSIEIEKVERTYSYIPDESFRRGRTVTGVIAGTDCKATVQLPEARNDELDALQSGSRLQVSGKLLKWNTIYDRLEMREA